MSISKIGAGGLAAGSVLQVVMGTKTGEVTTSSNTAVDSGLSATITPSSASSKVLIFANVPDAYNNVFANLLYLNIARGSTEIIEFARHANYNASGIGMSSHGGSTSYLDTPNTTLATTYKVQFKTQANSIRIFLNGSVGTIVLMEIAG
tara:strand:- start:226 stop:672 length:447 start_codon:yes stop_codon:yes gene_type:complete